MYDITWEDYMEKNKTNLMAKFLVPSIVGIVLFMIPVKFDGSWTIAVKILADMIGNAIGGILPVLCVGIVTISAIMSALSLAKPKFITEQPILRDTFLVGPIWVVIRVLGAIFIWLTFLEMCIRDRKYTAIHFCRRFFALVCSSTSTNRRFDAFRSSAYCLLYTSQGKESIKKDAVADSSSM